MSSKLFNLKSLSKGIGYSVLFFILPSIIQIPFNFIKNNIPLSYNLEFIIVYLITTIIFMIIIKKDLKENIKTYNIKIL